jgi:hypothetical protein
MTDDDDPERWLARSRRHNALRVLAIGLVVLIPTAVWLAMYYNYEGGGASRVRMVGMIGVAIGVLLTGAGGVMFARARR